MHSPCYETPYQGHSHQYQPADKIGPCAEQSRRATGVHFATAAPVRTALPQRPLLKRVSTLPHIATRLPGESSVSQHKAVEVRTSLWSVLREGMTLGVTTSKIEDGNKSVQRDEGG